MTASDNSHELRQQGAWLSLAEVDTMVQRDPDALLLLAYLRSHSAPWGGFTCPNALSLSRWDGDRSG